MAGDNDIASLKKNANAIADSDQRLWVAATYHFDDDVRCRSLGVFGDASSKDWLKLEVLVISYFVGSRPYLGPIEVACMRHI
jgi:hypothetical protein